MSVPNVWASWAIHQSRSARVRLLATNPSTSRSFISRSWKLGHFSSQLPSVNYVPPAYVQWENHGKPIPAKTRLKGCLFKVVFALTGSSLERHSHSASSGSPFVPFPPHPPSPSAPCRVDWLCCEISISSETVGGSPQTPKNECEGLSAQRTRIEVA